MSSVESKQLLLSAQSFGFGPTTRMLNIVRGLRQHPGFKDINLILRNSRELSAVYRGGISRTDLWGNTPDQGVLDYTQGRRMAIDGVFAVYDSEAALYAWMYDLPCFFYDGMLSSWNINMSEEEYLAIVDRMYVCKQNGDINGLIRLYRQVADNNHHEAVFLAYFLSDINFARKADRDQEVLARFSSLQSKTKVLGAVVHPEIPYDDSNTRREHVLVSLSASVVPTVSFEDNLQYAQSVIDFVSKTAPNITFIPWIVSVNPQLYKVLSADGKIEGIPANVTIRPSFPYKEGLEHIKRAKLLFISPGGSTIHEAAYFHTPVIFLPEQNGGQPHWYRKIAAAGYPTTTDLTIFGNGLYEQIQMRHPDVHNFNQIPTSEIYGCSDNLFRHEDFSSLRERVREEARRILTDILYAQQIGDGQNSTIDRMIGGFDALSVIVEEVARALSFTGVRDSQVVVSF